MFGWITVEHFIKVLSNHGFAIVENDGKLAIRGHDDIRSYPIRADRLIPPKTFKRYVYSFGIDIEEFLPPEFKR